MDGLRLEIKSKLTDSWMEVYLEDDAEISMEVNSPLWNKTSTYSYPFSIPCAPNRHILGNSDQISGTSVYDMLYHRPIRLFVQGLLWVQGIIDMDKEIELEDGEIEINIVSGRKTLDETLEGVSLRDIDVESRNIQIGYCNNVKNGVVNDPNSPADGATVDVRLQLGVNYFASPLFGNEIERSFDSQYITLTLQGRGFTESNFAWYEYSVNGNEPYPVTVPGGTGVFNALQQLWPKLDTKLYSKNDVDVSSLTDCTNTSTGYDGRHMFCNIPVCWQRYIETGDGSWKQTRGYQDTKVHGDPGAPDRAGSAPCFFALAVIDMLFQDLEIPIVENALREIDDINRLALIHTDWHGVYKDVVYKDEQGKEEVISARITDNNGKYIATIFPRQDGELDGNIYGFKGNSQQGMLDILAEKGFVCGPLRALNKEDISTICNTDYTKDSYHKSYSTNSGPVPRLASWQAQEIKLACDTQLGSMVLASDDKNVDKFGIYNRKGDNDESYPGKKNPLARFIFEGVALRLVDRDGYRAKLNDPYLYRCYATSENLPDADAKSLIDGLESMFGARFMYDDTTGLCRIVLLREILSQQEVIDLDVSDYGEYKVENHVRGFRLKYSSSQKFEATALKKEEDVTTGDDETAYNYNDWDKVRMMNSEKVDSADSYGKLICNISCFDETCYVDYLTGNAYRIKVDKDAEVVDSGSNPDKVGLNPSLFEVGAFMAAEIGDCSDNELVEEVSIGLTPVTVSDMHYEDEKAYYGNSSTSFIGVQGSDTKDPQPSTDDKTINSPTPKYAVFCQTEVHQGRTSVVSYDYNVGTMTGETYKITKKVKEWVGGKEEEVERDIVKTRSVSLPVTLTETYPNMGIGWDLSQGFDSPLQKCDFGMTVGVLRTGGSTGGNIIVVESDYDGLGHASWTRMSAGAGQVTSDSVDTYGNIIGAPSYTTGEGAEVQAQKPLSLKIIAKKKNPYHGASPENKKFKMSYDPYKDICDEDGYFLTESNASQRGLYYDYYCEYAYWVINRKIVRFTIPANHISLSQLCNIDMTRKYKIGTRIGFINKISYRITNNGISDVEIELYYL